MTKLDKKMFKEIPKVVKIDDENSIYIPKIFFESEMYKNLNINSIILYGFLMDSLLSGKAMKDEMGYLYIIIRIDDILQFFSNKISKSTIIKCRNLLVENNLLALKNNYSNRPSFYYLLKPYGM